LQEWSFETTDDPFSGGQKVDADFMSSFRSGVFVLCDTAEFGLDIRAIAGWQYDAALEGVQPEGKFAVDGKILFSSVGRAASFGSNIAGVRFFLDQSKAAVFVEAMKVARKQIAVLDGISDKPHLLPAKGSTRVGEALEKCLAAQSRSGGGSSNSKVSNQDPVSVGIERAKFLGFAAAVQANCPEYKIRADLIDELDKIAPDVAESIVNHISGMIVDAQREVSSMSCDDAAEKAVQLSDGLLPHQVWQGL
jgi:hypothetical protein